MLVPNTEENTINGIIINMGKWNHSLIQLICLSQRVWIEGNVICCIVFWSWTVQKMKVLANPVSSSSGLGKEMNQKSRLWLFFSSLVFGVNMTPVMSSVFTFLSSRHQVSAAVLWQSDYRLGVLGRFKSCFWRLPRHGTDQMARCAISVSVWYGDRFFSAFLNLIIDKVL